MTDTNDYYKDLWTAPNHHGTIFWRDVNFDTPSYKLQELRFRNMLQSLKRWNKEYVPLREISSVLEVGAGTGRMTKIVIDEFGIDDEGSIMRYDCVDLQYDRLTLAETIGPWNVRKLNWWNMDITGQDFDIIMRGKQYDLVLASEVFMHIKPSDIETVLKRITSLLAPNGLIINIDWFYEEEGDDIAMKPWCFIHDYDKLYTENGLTPVFIGDIREIKQKMFCYGK